MAQDLVGRVQRLLMSPKTEWDAIDVEPVDTQKLITGYVVPLAAIPAVAGVIGFGLFGGRGLIPSLISAIVTFGLQIGWIFVFAYIINALAPTFGAQKNYNQALKVTAYAPTAGWIAGIFNILPVLAVLALIGSLYSLYLLFLGLPKLMKVPADKAVVYTLASIAAAIVASVLIGAAAALFMTRPGL